MEKINLKTIKRNPQPPFITSKLQQDAINRLKFSAKKTMMVAQQLYEGIEIGTGGPEGLITYMRTDSTRIADEAAQAALALIREKYGNEYAGQNPSVSLKIKIKPRMPMRPSGPHRWKIHRARYNPF